MRYDRITTTPGVMRGQPCIRGMRVTASMVAGLVASGMSADEILRAYPYLEAEDIVQAVAFDAAYQAWLASEKEFDLAVAADEAQRQGAIQ